MHSRNSIHGIPCHIYYSKKASAYMKAKWLIKDNKMGDKPKFHWLSEKMYDFQLILGGWV